MPRGTYATQGKELNWNLSFTEWPLSVLCWRQFWRDYSACSSARQAWTIFSVLPPKNKQIKQQQQQHKNNRRWSDCRTLLTADQSHKSLSRLRLSRRVFQTRSNLGVLITPTSQDERGQQRRPPLVSPAASPVQHVTSCVCNNARQSSVTGPARHSASTTMARPKCPVSPVQHVTTFQVASVVSTVCSIDSYFIYS